jgi:hypothetical protein
MPGNDDMAYFVTLSPALFWRRKLLADQNSLLIEEAQRIKPEILDEVFQEPGALRNLLARHFQRMNPAFEEPVIRCGVVVPSQLQKFSNVF